MQGYLNKGKEVLKRLLTNGYEAYFFRETVRNSILKLDCDEIYIMTAASVEELSSLFIKDNFTYLDKQTSQLIIDDYKFIITSFEPTKQDSAHQSQGKSINSNLLANLSTSNFTINSLSMTASGKITDAYDGYKDITKKAIKTIGPAKQRFYDNPIFMLNAMVIISELNFALSSVTEAAIKKRISFLSKISPDDVAKEMRKILAGRYAKKALLTMVKLGMTKGLPFFEKVLRKYLNQAKEYDYDTLVTCALIENKEENDAYIDTCNDPSQVITLYNVALANPKSKFDSLTLFTYGVDICTAAYKLNKLLGHTTSSLEKKIAKNYEALPIKKKCDVKFKGEDIMRISDLRDADEIGDMFEDIVYQVITGELPNDYEKLEKYACDLLREKNIYFDVTRKTIVGIKPRIVEKEEESHDIKSDYDKFINNINTKTESDYQRDLADDYGKDESKFELPGKPRVLVTKAEYSDSVRAKTTYNEEYDDINYDNYRDPRIPSQESLTQPSTQNRITNPYNAEGYPFESDFENRREVMPNGEYVKPEGQTQDEIIKRLEERLNAQDRIIRENAIELNKQKIATSATRVTTAIIEAINKDQSLPRDIDKDDFEKRLNEFIYDYLNNKLSR